MAEWTTSYRPIFPAVPRIYWYSLPALRIYLPADHGERMIA